jgi:hypothetical protein
MKNNGNRYFDVEVEYAKAGPDDLLIRVCATNRGPGLAPLHILPTLWFRNTWCWQSNDDGQPKPCLSLAAPNLVRTQHNSLGSYQFAFNAEAKVLFTENGTNAHRLRGVANPTAFVKDISYRHVRR